MGLFISLREEAATGEGTAEEKKPSRKGKEKENEGETSENEEDTSDVDPEPVAAAQVARKLADAEADAARKYADAEADAAIEQAADGTLELSLRDMLPGDIMATIPATHDDSLTIRIPYADLASFLRRSEEQHLLDEAEKANPEPVNYKRARDPTESPTPELTEEHEAEFTIQEDKTLEKKEQSG